jgi:hypothetical protein
MLPSVARRFLADRDTWGCRVCTQATQTSTAAIIEGRRGKTSEMAHGR